MSLIIDGHNLIGILPDIQLDQPDDERRLLERLRAYRAWSGGRSLIVFFDSSPSRLLERAMYPQGTDLSSPGIQVRFAEPGQTADDAIVEYLRGRAQPGQYAVVTNDQGLSWRVRDAGASVLSASEFAVRLKPTRRSASASAEPAHDPHDPAFADLYAGFIESEKARARFRGEKQADLTTWIERLYEGDPQLAERAARWLGNSNEKAALQPLHDALTHDDAGVRAAALLALGDLGNPAALPDLCDRLIKDGNSMVREAAAQSLGRLGDRTVEATLKVAAETDHKSKVRKAAREALEQIRARKGAGKQGNT
jgi:predicted RNA-binding protein with PIN domain